MRAGKSAKKAVLTIVSLIVLLAGAAAAGYFATNKLIVTGFKTKADELEATIDTNTHNVFVANEEIRMGDVITEEKLRVESQLLTNASGIFTEENLGTKALVNIPKDAVMYAAYSSAKEQESTARLVEYTCMYLSATLNKGDYVDVRIRYQNGEDFSLLAKKQIEEISIAAKSCHLIVNARELQMMASAIIDANEFNAVIYCVKYMSPSVQEATEITYPARAEILSVLYPDGGSEYLDLMKKRGALENRLIAFAETVDRAPIEVSNFGDTHGKEQSNTNDTGVTSTPPADIDVDSEEE